MIDNVYTSVAGGVFALDTIVYGRPFTVESSSALYIDEMSLIGLGAATHSFDHGQRFMRLGVALPAESDKVYGDAPQSPNEAPPGYYMLFILDDGIPSNARIVRLTCASAGLPASSSGEPGYAKNRYVSFVPPPGTSTALRATLTQFHDPAAVGRQWWLGAPIQVCERANEYWPTTSPPNCTLNAGTEQRWFWAAPLVCGSANTHYSDWSTLADRCVGGSNDGGACVDINDCPNGSCGADPTVHVYGPEVVPSKWQSQAIVPTIYEVQAIHESCDPETESNYSAPLVITMSRWGDVAGIQSGGEYTAPDGVVDLHDVNALLLKFSNEEEGPMKARCDIVGNIDPMTLDHRVDNPDIDSVLDAFPTNAPYPFNTPAECP